MKTCKFKGKFLMRELSEESLISQVEMFLISLLGKNETKTKTKTKEEREKNDQKFICFTSKLDVSSQCNNRIERFKVGKKKINI